jgi:hypothetical protein
MKNVDGLLNPRQEEESELNLFKWKDVMPLNYNIKTEFRRLLALVTSLSPIVSSSGRRMVKVLDYSWNALFPL